MSKTNNEKPQPFIEEIFVTLKGLQGLSDIPTEGANSSGIEPPLFAELLHYLFGTAAVDGERIEGWLKSDLNARRTMNQLLNARRQAYLGREARADDGSEVNEREGQGFKLRFNPSNANKHQIYVILKVSRDIAADHSTVSLVAQQSDMVRRLKFPMLQDNQTQILLSDDDERLRLLRDSETELSLVMIP